MKKIVYSYDELTEFVNPLVAEQKWAIDIAKNPDESYTVQWIEHKNYTAHDGKTFPDELWITQDGDLRLIQDLEPEHARNILRMLLRKERAQVALIEEIIGQYSTSADETHEQHDLEITPEDTASNRTLH